MATKKKLLQAAAGFGASDPDFKYVTALFDFDGTTGANNNTVSDSSPNQFSMTENGEVNQGSFSPYGNHWSNYFDGSGDQINVPDSNGLDFGTGAFTVELWFYIVSQSNNEGIISKGGTGTGWQIIVSNTNNQLKFIRTSGSASSPQITSGDVDLGKWYHLALTRDSSNDVRLFLNGTQEGTYSDSTNWDTSTDLRIGTNRGQNNDFHGYISNVRVIKGTALYTSAFTPPYSPLSAVTNTNLLTSQSHRFVDNSSTAASLTFGGEPRVSRFSPFLPTKERTFASDGGSQYFNLTDSYLTYSGGSTVDKITISFWIYVTGSMAANGGLYPRVFCSASNAFLIYLRDDDIRIYNGGEKLQTPIRKYEWQYFVAQLTDSGWQMWLNGVSTGTNSSSGNNINLSTTNYIGRDATNAGYFGGYLCDLKVTEGVEYSSANFTPPTAPVSSTIGGPFDLIGASYDSKSFSVSSQETNPLGS